MTNVHQDRPESKITASFTFRGQEFQDIEVLDPGAANGITWLMEISGGVDPLFIVVEAETLGDAIDTLVESPHGEPFMIDEANYADYGINVATCDPGSAYMTSAGLCDLGHLSFHGDDRTGFPCRYHVTGWADPVEPAHLPAVLDAMERAAEFADMVTHPGKFEGCAAYVPYFWDAYLNGGADDDERGVVRFDVADEDRRMFPELADVAAVFLFEDENGFITDLGRPADPDEDFSHDPIGDPYDDGEDA